MGEPTVTFLLSVAIAIICLRLSCNLPCANFPIWQKLVTFNQSWRRRWSCANCAAILDRNSSESRTWSVSRRPSLFLTILIDLSIDLRSATMRRQMALRSVVKTSHSVFQDVDFVLVIKKKSNVIIYGWQGTNRATTPIQYHLLAVRKWRHRGRR